MMITVHHATEYDLLVIYNEISEAIPAYFRLLFIDNPCFQLIIFMRGKISSSLKSLCILDAYFASTLVDEQRHLHLVNLPGSRALTACSICNTSNFNSCFF